MLPHNNDKTVMWSLQVSVNEGRACRSTLSARFSDVVTVTSKTLPEKSTDPVFLFWWKQCPCPSEGLPAVQPSCHEDGLPARLHQLCQPNHRLITVGGEGEGGGARKTCRELRKTEREGEKVRQELKNEENLLLWHRGNDFCEVLAPKIVSI